MIPVQHRLLGQAANLPAPRGVHRGCAFSPFEYRLFAPERRCLRTRSCREGATEGATGNEAATRARSVALEAKPWLLNDNQSPPAGVTRPQEIERDTINVCSCV